MPTVRCGVYVHIPYCSRKCDYCAFHSITNWTAAAQHLLIDKILADAALFAGETTSSLTVDLDSDDQQRRSWPDVEARTLYIGGGTPGVLAAGQLGRLIGGVTTLLGTPGEITCEANPESAGTQFLHEASRAGVTRLSIGVQSLSARLSSVIGRTPTSVEDLRRIRSGWDGRLSADLIIGIPGQTTDHIVADIQVLWDLGFSHLSIYELSVEPDTPLSRRVASGGIRIPEDGHNWQTVCETFSRLGFVRYEVSNFALPGNESQHNLGYWRAMPYLGLGPSATSTLPVQGETVRFVGSTNHADFLRGHPFLNASREHLKRETLVTEYLMLGLRTAEGVSYNRFQRLFGIDLDALLGNKIAQLCARNLLVSDKNSVRPTHRGMDLLNRVLVELLCALEGSGQASTVTADFTPRSARQRQGKGPNLDIDRTPVVPF